jgi:hypothetical protein
METPRSYRLKNACKKQAISNIFSNQSGHWFKEREHKDVGNPAALDSVTKQNP